MKIGVFVGSFNPVHIGHIKLVNELIDKKYVDKIYIIPTEPYWNKQDLISLKDRINMLKYFETDKIIIDTKHNKYEYTYQILNDLKNSSDQLYLIIGADNLKEFHLWKNIDEILKNKIIVINRNGIDTSKYINNFKNNQNFIVACDIEQINISSTMVRENKEYRKFYLDRRVLDYINKNNLYERGNYGK